MMLTYSVCVANWFAIFFPFIREGGRSSIEINSVEGKLFPQLLVVVTAKTPLVALDPKLMITRFSKGLISTPFPLNALFDYISFLLVKFILMIISLF